MFDTDRGTPTYSHLARRACRPGRRRGVMLLYCMLLLVVLMAVASLGLDYAHVQSVKTEEQRSADLTARGLLQMYASWGNATVSGYSTTLANINGVDGKFNGGAATPTITWGSYDPATDTFAPNAASRTAVKVTISRAAASNNPVRLIFPQLSANGALAVRTSVDVSATAVAYVSGGASGNVTVPATASLYLSGLPAGSTTAGWGDNTSNATPFQVTSVPVAPGSYITVGNASGTSTIVPGRVAPTGAAGNVGVTIHHGENYDHSPDPGYDNPENGIGDATMPADALCGVFLTAAPPTAGAAPPAVDWTVPAQGDRALYDDLKNQQPFMIGTGQTSKGVVKRFRVPANATRLFLSVWDGVCYSNNSGSVSATLSVPPAIVLVR